MNNTSGFGKHVLSRGLVTKVLRSVPYWQGFHFFFGIGLYTGTTATSLADFFVDLQTIDLKSVEFHFGKRDGEKWIVNFLEDEELASQIAELGAISRREETRKSILIILGSAE